MFLLGVTGSMGCGKSRVSKRLVELGAHLLDSDQLARAAVAPGSEGLRRVAEYFGAEVIQEDGSLNRRRLGELVFENPARRKELEGIIHPQIWRMQAESLTRWQAETPDAVVVLEIPLLFETGAQRKCDLTVTVACGEQQMARLAERGNMDEATKRRVIAQQTPEAEKKRLADVVIDNSGQWEATEAQIQALWGQVNGRQGKAWPWPGAE
ncbi:dephospho-CoA kinase [Magnetofaba australis]|uniref:Dephospho-CoA kinase n=1 Tax=Magnetofaba australis IT-1 TaxID=1434232 RepID=A0A1Y2K3P9_9PROT|nr:dephospho-CoA kinase [Magnetofaba australis]OSM03950.1 putative dephospho-CoA kinase [Magnetofaba australis IT-1]